MRKTMSVSVFVLLALLWSAALGVASAQEPPPEDPNLPLSGLDDSADKIVMQKASRCANLENPDQKIDVIVQFARTPLQDSGWFIFSWKLVYTFDRQKNRLPVTTLIESQPLWPAANGRPSPTSPLRAYKGCRRRGDPADRPNWREASKEADFNRAACEV